MGRANKKLSVKKPEARHYEAALDLVASFYPTDIFGRGDQPMQKDLDEDVLTLVQSKAARMARLTCENVLIQARLLAENE
jgi:hypothetical protein